MNTETDEYVRFWPPLPIDEYYAQKTVSAVSLIKAHQAAIIRNLDLYPNGVVLDLKEEIKAFWEGVGKAEEFELSIDDSISEVLLYIGNEKDALQDGIPALGQDIKAIHERESGFKDGQILSETMMEFGKAIFHKLKQFGAYTPEGILPYDFNRVWADSTSPCLTKSEQCGAGD